MTILPDEQLVKLSDKREASGENRAGLNSNVSSGQMPFVHKQRLRDLSIMVTVIGVLLLCTALPRIFLQVDGGGEIPQIGLAIFGTWLVLIVVAFFLSNRLLKDENSE